MTELIKKTFHKSFIKNCPSGGVFSYTFSYVKKLLGWCPMKLNFRNQKNSRSHPIISQIPKYRRLNPTQNRYQPTPRNILNFAFIPWCRGKVLASHRTVAPRFSRF